MQGRVLNTHSLQPVEADCCAQNLLQEVRKFFSGVLQLWTLPCPKPPPYLESCEGSLYSPLLSTCDSVKHASAKCLGTGLVTHAPCSCLRAGEWPGAGEVAAPAAAHTTCPCTWSEAGPGRGEVAPAHTAD